MTRLLAGSSGDASGNRDLFLDRTAAPAGVGPLVVNNPEADVYTVSGTPTDSTFLALNTLVARVKPGFVPDVVVSGPNPGTIHPHLRDPRAESARDPTGGTVDCRCIPAPIV